MSKVFKFTIYLLLVFLLTMGFSACKKQDELSNSDKKVMIEDVNFSSLTEAVNNAKEDDTIKIYSDVKDNKNVVITKPLSLIGISTSSQTRPKFYGSITIDLSGETESMNIENIELIHSGKNSPDLTNDTSVGINLIDGGLSLKSSTIALESPESADNNAQGIVLSRKLNSLNKMPITLIGNNFESYFSNNLDLSSALVIKSNLDGLFKQLILNEEKIFNENNFSFHKPSNQFVAIDYTDGTESYTFYATSSLNDFVKVLNSNQSNTNSTYILYANTDQKLSLDISELTINEKSNVYVYGDSNLDFNGLKLKLGGTLESETPLLNLSIEKISDTANFIDSSQI